MLVFRAAMAFRALQADRDLKANLAQPASPFHRTNQVQPVPPELLVVMVAQVLLDLKDPLDPEVQVARKAHPASLVVPVFQGHPA